MNWDLFYVLKEKKILDDETQLEKQRSSEVRCLLEPKTSN